MSVSPVPAPRPMVSRSRSSAVGHPVQPNRLRGDLGKTAPLTSPVRAATASGVTDSARQRIGKPLGMLCEHRQRDRVAAVALLDQYLTAPTPRRAVTEAVPRPAMTAG